MFSFVWMCSRPSSEAMYIVQASYENSTAVNICAFKRKLKASFT